MRTLRLWPAAGLLLGAALLFAQDAPAPTQTPRPRLSGGFGRTPIAREPEAEPAPTPAAEDAPGSALSDVVKAASDTKAKKEAKAKSQIAITNKTLVTNPQRGKLTTYSTTPLPTPEPAPAGAPGEAAAGGEGRSPQAGDETYWRQTSRAARARVEELKIRIAELEAASKRMENDFYSWDDGQYRDRVIKPAWDKTRQELETSQQELERAEKDLAELPDKARKAGALPGWLRE
jgi:hypothetical protein